MKHLLLLLTLSFLFRLSAQNHNVTFQVDMSGTSVNNAGIHIAGNFQTSAGYPANWDPSSTVMNQVLSSKVYEISLSLPVGLYEYKFINGNSWGNDETVPFACASGGNRALNLNSDTTLLVCFASCSACIDTFNVRVQVDLSQETTFNPASDSVDIAGPFSTWNGTFDANYALSDPDGDLVYTGVFAFAEPVLNYKARFHNGAGTNWEQGLDKSVSFNSDTIVPIRCFGSDTLGACFSPPDTFNITLQVDLSQELGFDASTDSVDIAGPFSTWNGAFDASYALSDPDGDLVYTGVFAFAEPVLNYKARFHNGAGTNWEQGLDKTVSFNGDTIVAVRCFSSDTLGACPITPITIDSSWVTLQVDLSNETTFNPLTDTVDIAGPFNAWTATYDPAYVLSDPDGDSVFTGTFHLPDSLLEYKARFHNGSLNWEQGGNKTFTFFSDTLVPVRCFSSDTLGACPITPITIDSSWVTLQVDLSNETTFNPLTDTVDIAGPFNAWTATYDPAYVLSDPDGDSVFTGTFHLPDSLLEYKARFHNGSLNWEQGGNKTFTFFSDTLVPVRCFSSDTLGACPFIPDTFNITLQVDLSQELGFDASTDSVDIAGPFSTWNGAFDASYALSDPDGDLVYTGVFAFAEPVLNYKARFHNGAGTNWEQGLDKTVSFNGDTIVAVRCFSSDTLGACPITPITIDSSWVTLQVDLSNETTFNPLTDTVDIAGPFNAWTATYDPAYALSDPDGDSVFTGTFHLPDSLLEYKARFHNGSLNWEQGGNKTFTFFSDTLVPVRCFGSDTLGACPFIPDTFNITLQVDLSQELGFDASTDSVDIAGPFSTWNGAFDTSYALSDPDGDLVYTGVFAFAEPLLSYKARFHNGAGTNWEQGLDKTVSFNDDTIVPIRCFGSDTLGACYVAPLYNITLQIDMSQEANFNPLTDSIDIAGPFTNWNNNFDPNYELNDPDGNLVYDILLLGQASPLEYKARYHNSSGTSWELGMNKQANFSSDSLLPVRCFNSDTSGYCPIPPPQPGISFITNAQSAMESTGTVSVGLVLSPANNVADTALIVLNQGLGLSANDFSTNPAAINDTIELPIPANTDSLYFNLIIIDDQIVESNEMLSFSIIGTRGNVNISSPNTYLFTIIDDDIAPINNYSIAAISASNSSGVIDSIGLICRLSGRVFSPDFRSSNGYDFHIYDASGGINIVANQDLNSYQVALGDDLELVGTVQQYQGLLQFNIDSLKVLSNANPLNNPNPISQLDEWSENRLVRINGLRFIDTANAWTNTNSAMLYLAATNGPDTVMVQVEPSTNIFNNPYLSGYFNLTGIGIQRDSLAPFLHDYYIRPRQYSDFNAINLPPICITEVMVESVHPTAIKGDWFEIYNYGNFPINLNGYRFGNNNITSQSHTINSNISINPGERVILVDAPLPADTLWLQSWKQFGNGPKMLIPNRDFFGFPNFKSTGDEAYLFDATSHLVSYVKYQATDITSGYSLQFQNNGSLIGQSLIGQNGSYLSVDGDVGSPSHFQPFGIKPHNGFGLAIYPNPAKHVVYIESNSREAKKISLIDSRGRLQKQFTSEELRTEMEVTSLPTGLYHLRITINEVEFNQKIVIEK